MQLLDVFAFFAPILRKKRIETISSRSRNRRLRYGNQFRKMCVHL